MWLKFTFMGGLFCLILWFLLGGHEWIRATLSHGFWQYYYINGIWVPLTQFIFSLLTSFLFFFFFLNSDKFVCVCVFFMGLGALLFWHNLKIMLGLHVLLCLNACACLHFQLCFKLPPTTYKHRCSYVKYFICSWLVAKIN